MYLSDNHGQKLHLTTLGWDHLEFHKMSYAYRYGRGDVLRGSIPRNHIAMEGGLGFDVSMIMICVLVLTFLYLFCGSNEREIDATARPKARVIVQDKFCNKR